MKSKKYTFDNCIITNGIECFIRYLKEETCQKKGERDQGETRKRKHDNEELETLPDFRNKIINPISGMEFVIHPTKKNRIIPVCELQCKI